MSYDSWLERPYQERAAESDAFVSWCEANDVDPDDDDAYDAFRCAMDERYEDAAIEAAERRAEARAEAMADRDW